ncbi:MAG: acetyl-CoA carboxylase biotin carboxylase subunit [Acidobacteriota bacterium]
MQRVLIANRGEIALRVQRACRDLDLETVAVYSTADRTSAHVLGADQAICIGPPPAAQSYLRIDQILAAVEVTGADAVHPGYGFLSENAEFAERLMERGVTWIGPSPDTLRRMGDKAEARSTAVAAGVPILPGSDGPLDSVEAAAQRANEIGYPVILKAASGGGGKGMRVATSRPELEKGFALASKEAESSFADGRLYLEKYLVEPRHIEIQIFGDADGRIVDFGERECSLQRRHQKLVEESPAPGLGEELRREIAAAAVKLGEAVDYRGAGTVEFLLDEDGSFSFMEMNTRIQVEHPVTELVTGIDLVKLQLEVAAGGSVPEPPEPRGHALECRINAENPRTFLPSPGRIGALRLPSGPGVRIDTHVYADYAFPPFYDSLLGKFISYGRDRDESIARMSRALREFEIEGLETTAPLHARILRDRHFRAGHLSTRFMERFLSHS